MSNCMPKHVISIGAHSQANIPIVSDILRVPLYSIFFKNWWASNPLKQGWSVSIVVRNSIKISGSSIIIRVGAAIRKERQHVYTEYVNI